MSLYDLKFESLDWEIIGIALSNARAPRLSNPGIESNDESVFKPFAQQVALISGGGTGIGRAFARGLLSMGLRKVIIASRRESVLGATAESLNREFAGERIVAFGFNIRSRMSPERLVQRVFENYGTVDLLVNNAGLAVPESITSFSEAGWGEVLDWRVSKAIWLVQQKRVFFTFETWLPR